MGSERGDGYKKPGSLGEGTGTKVPDNSEAPQRATASRLVPTHHNDLGTSSMGRLTAPALICAMAAAVFFQPALMGPPCPRPSRSEPAFEPPQEPVPSTRPEAEMADG